jgi:Alpha/beta hydrolase domain
MIHVNATHDAQVWPNGVAAYKQKVRAHEGERIDDSYRLWWVEHAPHGAPQILGPAPTPLKDSGVWKSRLVDYDGVTAQALRDLISWVEDGIAPPMSTGYSMTSDGQITLSADAKERGGVQPVAHATANGTSRADVKVGETVTLVGTAQQPPGTGTIVTAEWDFAGRGAYEPHAVDGDAESVTVEASHVYEKPGTYFASFRVGSHRDGVDGKPPFARNNARVRVVVHP